MSVARSFAAAASLTVVVAGSLASSDATAQQIYKIIGSDGRVTFSDKAPMEPNVKASPAPVVSMASGGGANLTGLPFEVRQAAARYPVTLYTTDNCNACVSSRIMLNARGIPFSEKTVSTGADFEALRRLSGGNSLPLLTIGSQQLKGFGESEWSQFLDAAGYPQTSQLPRGYVPSAAAPLVALDQPKPVAPAAPAQTPLPASAESAPAAENPAGIRF